MIIWKLYMDQAPTQAHMLVPQPSLENDNLKSVSPALHVHLLVFILLQVCSLFKCNTWRHR